MPSFHDSRYKYLFSHPLLVQRLLTSFVDQPFVHQLDFSTLEKVSNSFVSPDFQRRESDIIWKITFQGRPIYIFLLIEFQSSPDRWMPLRFLRYIIEFYQSFLDTDDAPTVLPAIFPLLLYNGNAPWNVAETVETLIERSIPRQFIPHLSYYPLVIHTIPAHRLQRIHNAVSAVFYVENSDPEKLIYHLDTVVDIIRDEAPEVLTRFGRWFSNFLENSGDFDDPEFTKITSVTEVRTMFATKLEAYRKQLLEEGLEEGREQTRRETAVRLLRRGDTPEDVADITGLSVDTVNQLKETELE